MLRKNSKKNFRARKKFRINFRKILRLKKIFEKILEHFWGSEKFRKNSTTILGLNVNKN